MKNTWRCSKCNFDVFNSKTKCKVCLTKKTNLNENKLVSYNPSFDEEICNYFKNKHLEEKTVCERCKNEGRLYNKDPMLSIHNCWKYS